MERLDEQVHESTTISHDTAVAAESARQQRKARLLLFGALASFVLAVCGIWYDVQRDDRSTGETATDESSEGGAGVLPALFAIGFAATSTPVIFRVRRLRQAARGCTWREVELHSTEPLVAYEAHETHWFKFAEPVPRRFRAAISSHGSPDCDRHRWFAVRPTETDRVLLARIRRSKPQARPEPVRSELGSPRWRADDVGSVGCRLTSAGIERATSDAADSLFATVVLHRALSDAQLDVWQPRGPRLGHVEETARGLELKNTAGQLVVELERRFGEAAFLHRGVRVGSRNGSDLRVAGHLLQSRRWRRISRISGSLYCVLDADGELKAAARQRGWGDAVTVQLAPELEPVAAAVVLLQVAERFINRR